MRQRHLEEIHDPLNREPDGDGPGDSTDELREAGAAFLAAGDEAIDRALSENSAEFLAQNRQAGGQ